MAKRMLQIAHILDPWKKINPPLDSSIRLAWAASEAGHVNWYVQAEDLMWQKGNVVAHARAFTIPESADAIAYEKEHFLNLSDVDAIFLRKDPPFDSEYLHHLHLLSLIPNRPLCINDPVAIRNHNEKMSTLAYPEYIPPTAIARKISEIRSLVKDMGGRAVLKPLHLFGGKNIFVVDLTDRNFNAIAEVVTEHETHTIMVQKYLEEISKGDIRVLLIDGQMLGSFTRIAGAESYRSNVAAGGRWYPYELNESERKMVDHVAQDARSKGLYFLGLDLIGGKLTEINVTSPTGLPALNELTGRRNELTIIHWLEQKLGVN